MDSIRQEMSPGTLDATVTLRFKETETVYTESFRSTSLATSTDLLFNMDRIIASFDNIFTNEAAKATLTEVSIDISDRPQIMSAAIHKLVVPEEIIAGKSATFSVVLLPHWSATNGSRKIEKEVTLNIPENFMTGTAILNVTSGRPFGDAGFSDPFFSFGFDERNGGARPLPENLDELIKQMKEDQTDLDIITITFTPNGSRFGFPFQEPVEPSLPIETQIIIEGFIITGSKEKSVTVKGEDSPPIEIVDNFEVE